MKALTLTQPWATLVAIQAKRIETRSWNTSYRGLLAIHAAKGFPKWAKELCHQQPPFCDVLAQYLPSLPLGCIVATCRLVSVLPTRELQDDGTIQMDKAAGCSDFEMTSQERAFGDYEPGRFAWLFADIRAIRIPIPVKGSLGLWEFDCWGTGR